MVTAIEDVNIVRQKVPAFLRHYQKSQRIKNVLWNEPHKRSHKPAELVLFQSDLLSICIKLDKIKKLYNK